ncbi:MAG TPA: MFS transporter [Ktedonobacteraceae bacterium]|nr:MFS transporter [Ktedonobacteraceae bacterium]
MADSSLPGTASPSTVSATSGQESIEALGAPTQPKSLLFQILYGLANATIGLGNLTFYTILLPARIALVAPANQTTTFSIIAGLGALASLLTNPIVGRLSDQTTSPLGRRFPWILVGMLLLLLAMLLLAVVSTVILLGVGAVLLQIAINVILAALSAIIPDQVPLKQRATVSAFGAMAPLVGGVLGQLLVVEVIKDLSTSFLVLAQVSVCLLMLFLLSLREMPLPKDVVTPFRLVDLASVFWLNPKTHRDFALAWLARCLIFLVSTTLINYLFYLLQDWAHYTQVSGGSIAQGVQMWYTVYVSCLFVSALAFGVLSDKLQHRKPFVIASSLVMTAGLLLLTLFPMWLMVLLAAGIIGAGFGTYLAVDLALVSQLLPTAHHRGKDLGLMNAAIFLPMLIGPGIAGIALGGFHSYALLFIVLALAAVLAAVLIAPITSVP